MQVKTFAIAAVIAGASVAEAAQCRWHNSGSPALRRYYVLADGVDDVPGICGGLWDNMNGQSACGGVVSPYCGGNGGNLRWEFTIGAACNSGAVEAVWWEATRNRFGSVSCDFGGPI